MTPLQELCKTAQKKMTTKCKETLKMKFDALLSDENKKNCIAKENTSDGWVRNYSSKVLTMTETKVLEKGLNFALTPKNVPIPEILASVEDSLRKVKSSQAPIARINLIGALKNAKIPKSNVSPMEYKAIRDLQKDRSIIILPADKGKSTIILDKVAYERKIESMLADKETYKKLTRDPAPSLERKMNSLLLNLKRSGSLPDSLYFKLRSSAGKTPQLYGVPKIHKENIPLRPIVSFVNSPTYYLSKHLVSLISPVVGKTSSHVANSFEFKDFICGQNLLENTILVSFDVISLFTKVPVERATDIAHDRLLNDPTLPDRTMLTPDEIKTLLVFCLSATYLAYQNCFYQQTFGTAMGSPVSVTVANLIMEDVEDRALTSYESPPPFWKRYVDDIITVLHRDQIEHFKDHLDSIETSIKFTMEQESNGKLAFLDTEIQHHLDGSLSTKVYRKRQHTNKYLSYDSFHPINQKLAVARTLFHRAKKICSSQEEKMKEDKNVTTALTNNGFPPAIISRIFNESSESKDRENNFENSEKPNATVVLPYVGNVSEAIKRILAPLNIRTCFKPHTTLRQLLVHPKDPIQANKRNGVVYEIPCGTCNDIYIGQTSRTLDHRIKEHQRALTSADGIYITSAVAEHAFKTGHVIDWNKAKVIGYQTNWTKRCLLESWHIQKAPNTINREVGTLPKIYASLFP